MKTRAGKLLGSAVERGELTRERIERELSLTAGDIDELLDGRRVMSLDHQLCLAALLIGAVPRLARQGHALRAQVVAAMAFTGQQTEVHSYAPTTWRTLSLSSTGKKPRRT